MKVMTIFGRRPEIIRLSRVIVALEDHVEHVLVHTGQNYDYELNQVFFEDVEIRSPDHFLEAAGASAAETVGNSIGRSDEDCNVPNVSENGVRILFCYTDYVNQTVWRKE